MELRIGENIARYRKSKGWTQEQLGKMVGVSGQAVSKWENGGIPDTVLIPKLATVLDVTTDAIFGIHKKISDYTEDEILDQLFRFTLHNNFYKRNHFDYFNFLFETVWTLQGAYFGNEIRPSLSEMNEKAAGNTQITSQIINNSGTTYLTLADDFPLFCAVKDTATISEKLLTEKCFNEFFSLLASQDGFNAVIFTQSTTETSQYTAESMAEQFGITIERFFEIEPLLVKYGLLAEDSLTLDNKTIKIYHKWSNPEIRPILMLIYQFINARQCYYNFTSNRTKPYFETV